MKQHLKKYFFIALSICFFNAVAFAQFTTNLILSSRPPSYLSDWNNGIAGQLLVTYNTPLPNQNIQVKFATKLLDANGSVIATSNNKLAQPQTVRTGINTFRMDRVLQLENLQFQNGNPALAASGKLSAGTYSLSIQLLRVQDDSALTQPQQRNFSQVNYQLPYLLFPNNKTWLDPNSAQTAITFRWSSIMPFSQEISTYRLQVFEVQETQTPTQALLANQPILLTDVRRATQYIWQPHLFFKDSAAHIFIWTIQTLDSKGQPVNANDEYTQGRSEPGVFGITNNKEIISKVENWDIHISNDFKK
jgi:hypothetical protein